jgi:hypothetical protein
MFLVENRFCSGPLDGKSSDPGDRIGVGAVESIGGCHGAEESIRGRRMGGWNGRAVRFAYVDEEAGVEPRGERRYDNGILFITHPQSRSVALSQTKAN